MKKILKINFLMQFLLGISGAFSLELHFKGWLGTPVTIGLGFGLVPSGNKTKSEPVFTEIYATIANH